MNINHIVLEGNLTAAATLSHWTNGTAYARFTLANNRSYKDQNGEWQEIVSFIDCADNCIFNILFIYRSIFEVLLLLG